MSEPYWVALAGGGVDYKGDWASATAYKSGDVVRWNGVEFLAVNPSTGSIPPLAPSAAGQELAYVEKTTDTSVTVVAAASAVTVLSAPPITVDGATPVIIEFYSPSVVTAAGVAAVVFNLWDGSTDLGFFGQLSSPSGTAGLMSPARMARRITPSAGSHTYTVKAWATTGTGTIVGGAGSGLGVFFPAFIRISTSQPIRMGVAIPPTYGTSLPSSPLDGQEAVLVDSLTNPSYQWRFRYNAGSSSAYKWEFVGGPPLQSTLLDTTLSSPQISLVNQYVTLNPIVTVPRAGDYWCTGRQSIIRQGGTAAHNIYVGFGSQVQSITRLAVTLAGDVYLQKKITGLAAGANVYMALYGESSALFDVYDGSVSVLPVRVS